MKLSIVMPVLNEAAAIGTALDALQCLRARGHEVIVVDGASRDGTAERAALGADRVLSAPRGRAVQLNTGVREANGDIVLLLHVDTRLPADADRLIEHALGGSSRVWGRFDVVVEGESRLFPAIAMLMNARSRWSGIATGDQAIFATRAALAAIGGVPALALMEDVALSKALKQVSPPVCLREQVHTSGRRWIAHGVLRTVALMWVLRLAYFLGVPPERLARLYCRPQSST